MRYLAGALVSALIMLAFQSYSATKSSASVTISCNSDGTMNLSTAPR